MPVHYHVGENTPGCLPEGDPAIFRERGAAQAHARSLAEDLRAAGYRVTGNVRDGFLARRNRTLSGADRCVWIQECSDPSCKLDGTD